VASGQFGAAFGGKAGLNGDSAQPSLVADVPCQVKQIAIAAGTTRAFVGAPSERLLGLARNSQPFQVALSLLPIGYNVYFYDRHLDFLFLFLFALGVILGQSPGRCADCRRRIQRNHARGATLAARHLFVDRGDGSRRSPGARAGLQFSASLSSTQCAGGTNGCFSRGP